MPRMSFTRADISGIGSVVFEQCETALLVEIIKPCEITLSPRTAEARRVPKGGLLTLGHNHIILVVNAARGEQ